MHGIRAHTSIYIDIHWEWDSKTEGYKMIALNKSDSLGDVKNKNIATQLRTKKNLRLEFQGRYDDWFCQLPF